MQMFARAQRKREMDLFLEGMQMFARAQRKREMDLFLEAMQKFARAPGKREMNLLLEIVHNYSCTWRYSCNTSKDAVMVYGGSKSNTHRNRKNRGVRLGKEVIKEGDTFNYVRVRACLLGNFEPR